MLPSRLSPFTPIRLRFCVSKGLSAPVGSVLTGSREIVSRARGFRRTLGGNMRQAGLLAACGLVAFEPLVDRPADDRINGRRLAEGLQAIDPAWVDIDCVVTNVVMLHIRNLRPCARICRSSCKLRGSCGSRRERRDQACYTPSHLRRDVDRTVPYRPSVRYEKDFGEITPMPQSLLILPGELPGHKLLTPRG